MTYLTKTIHVVTIVMTAFTLTVYGFGIPPRRHKATPTWTRRHDVTTNSQISFPASTATSATSASTLPRTIWNQILSGMIIASTVWSSPASMAPLLQERYPMLTVLSHDGMAQAKEKASGSGSRVNKDPESLLRYGLPIQNKEVRLSQTQMLRVV